MLPFHSENVLNLGLRYSVPHFLRLIPELQFPGVSLPCPQCKRSVEVLSEVGVSKEVLQLLLGYRDENTVISCAARILGRFWADEFVKTERTYLELLLSALKRHTGLGVGGKLVTWSCRPEFQLRARNSVLA